jgi:trk system potassium uptake protein TrkH
MVQVFKETGKRRKRVLLRWTFSYLSPAQVLVLGFAALILIGSLLLTLPVAARSGHSTPFLKAIFTATSAVCVTGLVVVDTATHYSFFGQLVIIALIQAGGLGIMTMTTLFALLLGKKINLRERLIIQESLNALQLQGVVGLVKNIIKMTLLIEGAGGIILSLRFIPDLGWARGIYYGFFHSISSFCNAGFDLFGTVYGPFAGLTHFREDVVVSLTVPILIILGGLGFVVIQDVIVHRRFSRLSLHSKIALTITTMLVVGGTAIIWLLERDHALIGLSPFGTFLASFFQAVTPRTCGSNTLSISALRGATQFFMIILMFIGASPGSTGGGIKTTTFGALAVAAWSVIKGKSDPEVFERNIPQNTIFKSLAIAMLAAALIAVVTMILTITEQADFLSILFEATSAFGTVGLTMGLTTHLSAVGQALIAFTMYVGRVGPLTLALAIWKRQVQARYHYPQEKIIVG